MVSRNNAFRGLGIFAVILLIFLGSCAKQPFNVAPENLPPDTIISSVTITKVPLSVDPTGTKFLVTIQYYGLDPDGLIKAYSYRIDSGAWSDWLKAVSSIDTVAFSSLGEIHTYEVKAKDDLDKEDPTPAKATLSLQKAVVNALPETEITAGPVDGAKTSGGVTFELLGTDFDGSVVAFEYSVDGGAWTQVAADTLGKAKVEFSEAMGNVLPEGSHTFAVRAKDNLGAVDNTPASRSFLIKPGFAPIIVFTAGPADGGGWFADVDCGFVFKGIVSHYSGAIAGYSWAFDDSSTAAFSDWSSTNSVTIAGADVTSGSHFFYLKAKDTAGAISTAIIHFTAAKATLDHGIVLIDDCNYSEQEALEATMLADYKHTFWDIGEDFGNDPTKVMNPDSLGKYSTAIIFTDASPTTGGVIEILLGAYVKAGGNLWLTSYELQHWSADFKYNMCYLKTYDDYWCSELYGTPGSPFEGITIDTWDDDWADIMFARPRADDPPTIDGGKGQYIMEGDQQDGTRRHRGILADHRAQGQGWGNVVTWSESLRKIEDAGLPGLKQAADIILQQYFGETKITP